MIKIPKWFKELYTSRHLIYNRESYYKRNQVFKKYVFVIVIFIPIISFSIATLMPEIKISDDKLVINGMYGITKTMNELVTIDMVNQLPEIKSTDDGISMFKISKGSFLINNDEKAKMFVFKAKPPYIYIEYKRANKLYLNFKNTEDTRKFYRELRVAKDQGALP